eukprot:gene1608-2010_t
MTFKPSPAQQAFYDWVETNTGNCILNAVAGAGKTTTLRAVSNLLRGERGEVTKGSIELRGERIENLSP